MGVRIDHLSEVRAQMHSSSILKTCVRRAENVWCHHSLAGEVTSIGVKTGTSNGIYISVHSCGTCRRTRKYKTTPLIGNTPRRLGPKQGRHKRTKMAGWVKTSSSYVFRDIYVDATARRLRSSPFVDKISSENRPRGRCRLSLACYQVYMVYGNNYLPPYNKPAVTK